MISRIMIKFILIYKIPKILGIEEHFNLKNKKNKNKKLQNKN